MCWNLRHVLSTEDLADRMAGRGQPDGYVRETFSLPRDQARAKDGDRRRQAGNRFGTDRRSPRDTLFRLVPVADNDLSRSGRQVAIVAAETEDEARQIASVHDAFGRNWRDPHFAACESLETSETHVFGDVIFRSGPVAVEGSVGKAQMTWNACGSNWFSAHEHLTLPTA